MCSSDLGLHFILAQTWTAAKCPVERMVRPQFLDYFAQSSISNWALKVGSFTSKTLNFPLRMSASSVVTGP